MTLTFDFDEASLIRYACEEMTKRHATLALQTRALNQATRRSFDEDAAKANDAEALRYHKMAERIKEALIQARSIQP